MPLLADNQGIGQGYLQTVKMIGNMLGPLWAGTWGRVPLFLGNYGKEKKDSYFNSFLRPHFIDQLKTLLGSNNISNYLLSKKIRTQKC